MGTVVRIMEMVMIMETGVMMMVLLTILIRGDGDYGDSDIGDDGSSDEGDGDSDVW